MPISTSAAYQTAGAKPNRVPIFLLEIEGYAKGFSNADLGAFSPIPFPDQPGLSPTPTTSSAWVPDPLLGTYDYGTGGTTGPQSGFIERWGSNSLVSHTIPGILYFYNATGVYAAPGSDNPLAVPRSTLAAVFANVGIVIEQDLIVAPGWVLEASADGGSTWHTIANYTVSGTYSASLDITSFMGSIATFDFSQIQIRVYTNESLTEFGTPPGSVGTVMSVDLSFAYNSSIPTATAYPWLIDVDDQQLTVNDLDGGADLADLAVHVQDAGANGELGIAGAITQDFPSFVFEGKQVHLRAGWGKIDKSISDFPVPIIDVADFAILFTGVIDSVESENANNDYVFTCSDQSSILSRVIFGRADDGSATDSSHARTINGHPLDILLAILETELGMSAATIDVATITAYRDTIYSGAQMQFTITSPPVAKDFIEAEIMKPMGAFRYTNNLGQFAVAFFYPISIDTSFDVTEDNVIGIPEAGQTDLINEISTRFDVDSQGNFQAESIEENAVSVTRYGLYGSQVIESKGLRSGLNGFFFSAMTAFLIFLRYAFKALCHGDNGKTSSSSPITAIWSAALLNPGEFVRMTHSKVPDRLTGTMGISLKTYVVLDRLWQFFHGNVQYKMVEVDLSKFKQYLITSNGEASYTAASSGDKAALMFLCGDDDKYSNGNLGNTLC